MEETEVWKDIKGYEGSYQVSNLGRVKSISRIIIHPIKGETRKNEKILAPHKDLYCRVFLCVNGNKRRSSIHRLVADAFIPNPSEKPHINHLNGKKTDNRHVNLEWCTVSENLIHAHKTGLINQCGSRNPMAKLVLNTQNGVYYGCAKEAWESLGIYTFNYTRGMIGGTYRNKTPFIYA